MEMMDPGFSTIEMQDATTSMGLDFANSQSLATSELLLPFVMRN